jgi:hypothetical protein
VERLDEKNIDNILMGKRMIETAINLDESLSDLLKIEIKRLKQTAGKNETFEEFQKTNNLVKSIIMMIILTDDKIKTGLTLYLGHQ